MAAVPFRLPPSRPGCGTVLPASGSCSSATTRATCGTRFSARTVSELSRRRLIRRYGSGTRNSGQLVAVLRGHTAEVHAAAFAAHSSLLVSVASDGEARVWDMKLAERNGILRGHDGFVYDVAFSPDGTQRGLRGLGRHGTCLGRDYRPAIRRAATRTRKTGRQNRRLRGLAPRRQATCHSNTRRHDHPLGSGHRQTRQVFKAPTGEWNGEARAVFNPAGTLLASGSRDGSIRLWDVATGKPAGVLQGHEGSVLDVAFNPEGNQLASVGYDRTVRLWDLAKPIRCHDPARRRGGLSDRILTRTAACSLPARGTAMCASGTPTRTRSSMSCRT